MIEQQVEPAGGLTRPSTEVKLWSTYVLRAAGSATLADGTEIEAGAVIYAGRSTAPKARLRGCANRDVLMACALVARPTDSGSRPGG
jgi:hypothetical protein